MAYSISGVLLSLVDMDEELPKLCAQCQELITESPKARYEESPVNTRGATTELCFVLACQVSPAAQKESVRNAWAAEDFGLMAISFAYTLHGNKNGAKPGLLPVKDGMRSPV